MSACHVCFSKRRQGLFKKASDLSILCGAMVGVITFSPAGTPFSMGSPSLKVVIDERYLTLGDHTGPSMDLGIHNVNGVVNTLMLQCEELKESIVDTKIGIKKLEEEIEEKGCGSLLHCTTSAISGLGFEELLEIYNKLETISDFLNKEKSNQVYNEKEGARIVPNA